MDLAALPSESMIRERLVVTMLLQAAQRFGDRSMLAIVRTIVSGAIPSSASCLPPLLPSALRAFSLAHPDERPLTGGLDRHRDVACCSAWRSVALCSVSHGAEKDLEESGRLVLAVYRELEVLSEAGDAEAAFRLGTLFEPVEKGIGPVVAVRRTGAENIPPSIAAAGRSKRVLARDDAFAAESHFGLAASRGHAEASYRLSVILWARRGNDKGNGRGLAEKRDYSSGGTTHRARSFQARSVNQLTRASFGGSSTALLMLGGAAVRGDVPTTPAASNSISDASSRLGDPLAMLARSRELCSSGQVLESAAACFDALAAFVGPSSPLCKNWRKSEGFTKFGGCSCGVHCTCLPVAVALSSTGRQICEHMADLCKGSSASIAQHCSGGSNEVAMLADLWVARQGQFAKPKWALSVNMCKRSSTLAPGEGGASPRTIVDHVASARPPLNAGDIAALHFANTGRPLDEAADCGLYLNLLKSNLRAQDVPSVMEAFGASYIRSGVDRLGLSHNTALGREGACKLSICLAGPPCLQVETSAKFLRELFANECGFGPAGGLEVAAALPCCTALEKLGLNFNRLGDEGCCAVLGAIEAISHRTNGTLINVLGLMGNECTDTSALAASKCLCAPHCPLRRLYFNENRISDDGAVALATALERATSVLKQQKKHCGLERLGLSDNAIGPRGGASLLAALAAGAPLEKMCCSDNPFGSRVHSSLASLPNVFAGAKPRTGRVNQHLHGDSCRVLVVWKPPVAMF